MQMDIKNFTENRFFKWAKEKAWPWLKKRLIKIGIFGLGVADFFALYQLFDSDEADMYWYEAALYSIIFAVCLEGIPTFIGKYLNALKLDATVHKANDSKKSKWGLWFSFGGIIFAFLVLLTLRVLIIVSNGGWDYFVDDEYSLFPIDVFLTVSPILTSIMAFVASLYDQTDSVEKLREEVEELHKKYQEKNRFFLEKLHSLHQARTDLWTMVTKNKNSMPKTLEAYRHSIVSSIRGKLFRDCIEAFPEQLEMYNGGVENKLSECLAQMSKRSTIPHIINSIDIGEVIKEYDEKVTDPARKWELSGAKEEFVNELKKLCSNEIDAVQIQYMAESK